MFCGVLDLRCSKGLSPLCMELSLSGGPPRLTHLGVRTQQLGLRLAHPTQSTQLYLNIVVSVLPWGRFLASIFSTLSCFLPFSLVPHTTILNLTSHILGKSREVVSRCLPPGVFTETPSPASVSFTIRPSSSLFRNMGFAYTGENSVVHHALSFHRGTTCRWRGGQLGVEAFWDACLHFHLNIILLQVTRSVKFRKTFVKRPQKFRTTWSWTSSELFCCK